MRNFSWLFCDQACFARTADQDQEKLLSPSNLCRNASEASVSPAVELDSQAKIDDEDDGDGVDEPEERRKALAPSAEESVPIPGEPEEGVETADAEAESPDMDEAPPSESAQPSPPTADVNVSTIQRMLRSLTSASASSSPSMTASASPSASPMASSPERARTRGPRAPRPGYAAPVRPPPGQPASPSPPLSPASPHVPQPFQTIAGDSPSFKRNGADGVVEIYRVRRPTSDESQSEKLSDSGVTLTAGSGSSSAASIPHKHKCRRVKQRATTRRGDRVRPRDAAVTLSSPESHYTLAVDSHGDPDFGTPV